MRRQRRLGRALIALTAGIAFLWLVAGSNGAERMPDADVWCGYAPFAADTGSATDVDPTAARAVTTSSRTAIAAHAPTREHDTEWLRLPVSRTNLVAEILASPQLLRSSRLLRNATFNPRDMYVAPAKRGTIVTIVERGAERTRELIGNLQAVLEVEWSALHAQGATREVDLKRYGGAPQLREIGTDPLFRTQDGRTFGIDRALLPETSRATRALRQAAGELCGEIALAFAAAGVLTADEVDAIADEALRREQRSRSGSASRRGSRR